MTLQRVLAMLWRRWWFVLGVPILVVLTSLVLDRPDGYVAEARATVLIPGDTEDTGSAERPELMVLDDVSALVASDVFAAAILDVIRADDAETPITVEAVQASLTSERYSRVVTIRVSDHDATNVDRIALAAVAVFPDQVNKYLMADGADPATVRFLDLPVVELQATANALLLLGVQALVALGIGCGLAALAAGFDDRLFTADDVVESLGLPVLADMRGASAPRAPVPSDRSGSSL